MIFKIVRTFCANISLSILYIYIYFSHFTPNKAGDNATNMHRNTRNDSEGKDFRRNRKHNPKQEAMYRPSSCSKKVC